MGVLGFLHRLVRIGPILVRNFFCVCENQSGYQVFYFFGVKNEPVQTNVRIVDYIYQVSQTGYQISFH
jgi:hypothetical protein